MVRFLDEIGEMSLEAGKAFCGPFRKGNFSCGGSKNIPVDVRIIAATNQNIDEMVEEGRFRRDLFYRLNVIRLEIPPLRERHEDIIPLCYHFLEIFNKKI